MVFKLFKVLQNSIYAELKAWAGRFFILPTPQFFLQEKFALVYFMRQLFHAWETLGIVDIFTCSLLDVNWTFRSDSPPPPPPHPPEILLPQKSLHSQSHYSLPVCRNTCIICFPVDVVNADYSIQKRKLESVIKGRHVFKHLSSCLLFTNMLTISANLGIFGTVKLSISDLGWNSKDHYMHRLHISSLLNYA